tara:strand:+ start:22 stop:624 length:603 start_codon:yes stop_codon:yes gene_type:complete
MEYFDLLSLLPSDLVHYIFKIILREKNANIIINRFHFNNISNIAIHDIINFVYSNDIYISDNLIGNFNYLVYINISKKYNKVFWEHLLNLVSKRLGEIHTKTIMYNINTNNNIQYRNLKIIIKLWLKMCQKYSIKLQLSQYINIRKRDDINFTITNSKHIIKLLDFGKYFGSPRVVTNQYDLFDFNENYNFIRNQSKNID